MERFNSSFTTSSSHHHPFHHSQHSTLNTMPQPSLTSSTGLNHSFNSSGMTVIVKPNPSATIGSNLSHRTSLFNKQYIVERSADRSLLLESRSSVGPNSFMMDDDDKENISQTCHLNELNTSTAIVDAQIPLKQSLTTTSSKPNHPLNNITTTNTTSEHHEMNRSNNMNSHDHQNTTSSTALNHGPTLVLKQFANKVFLDFGKVKMNSGVGRVCNLLVANPTSKEQEIAVEKLPVQYGFTLREVIYTIPPLCNDFVIPIQWTPTSLGKVNGQLIFLWNTRFRFCVNLIGEAIPDAKSTAVSRKQPPLSTNSRMMKGTLTATTRSEQIKNNTFGVNDTFNMSTCNISAILPSQNSHAVADHSMLSTVPIVPNTTVPSTPVTTSSAATAPLMPTQRRTQPSTIQRTSVLERTARTAAAQPPSTNTLPPRVSTKITKPEKMKRENQSMLSHSKTLTAVAAQNNTSSLARDSNTSSVVSTTQKRIIQSTARSEIQKILERQRELERALPVSMPQLVHELKNFGIGIHQISLIQGYKDIRVAMLLQWVHAVLEKYENLPSKYKVWNFSSPSLKTEEELVFALISNQYRLPSPLPLAEILPKDDEEREYLHHYQYSDNGCWSASFSPTKLKTKPETSNKEYNEHEMVCKIGHLFNTLYQQKEQLVRTKALVVIQNWMLTIYWKRRLQWLRESSLIVQARVKAVLEQRKLDRMKEERKQRILMELTARLQGMARGYLARKVHTEEKSRICVQQALIRSFLNQRSKFECTQSALSIQAVMRMFLTREFHLDDKYDLLMCQAVIRAFLTRKQFYIDYAEVLEYNNMLEMEAFEKYINESIEDYDENVTLHQALAKGSLSRLQFNKSLQAITFIQSCVRQHKSRITFKNMKQDIISIQALARRVLERRKYAHEKERIHTQQALVRGFLSRECKQVGENRVVTMQSLIRRRQHEIMLNTSMKQTIIMQSLIRRFFNECDCLIDRYRAFIFQAASQGIVARRNKMESIQHVTTLQALIRGRLSRKTRDTNMESVSMIQRSMRDCLFRKHYSQFVENMKMIQSSMRSYSVQQQKHQRMSAIITIQSVIRGFTQRKTCFENTTSIISLQSSIRGKTEQQKAKLAFDSILSLQAGLRGKGRRESMLDDMYDITLSQAIVKGVLCRYSFTFEVLESVKCQSLVRGELERKLLEKQRERVTTLQSLARAYLQKESIEDDKYDVSLCQSIIRGFLQRKKLEQERQSLLNYQALVRSYLSNRFFNHIKSISSQMHSAATRIQKVFRGFMVRKSNADQVNIIRQRIQHLAENTDERKKLKNRTQKALEVLLKSNSVNQVMSACASLATTTKWSDNCCESLVTNGAVPILYTFIKMLNRSKPHMDLLIHILDILLHLTRIKYLNCLVHEKNEYFDILFDQAQIYREKEEIFMRAITLIKKADPKRLKNVKDTLLKRCTSVSRLMERKYTTEKKSMKTAQNHLNSSALNSSSLNISLNDSSMLSNRKQAASSSNHMNTSGVGRSVASSSLVLAYENIAELVDVLNKLK
ncbi:hypothetical protein C9374_009737 [Naegleria lovaniensis]|uniref:Abnormal spindle-like microcephaly-associated protein ASH domain-containing protein n=1 Tax=Naegleria lovaniensis TaxID=51637 RepID=A0AA88KXB1_NAELO|nr:uncharacterized protein C9374_009737 [Naegleria lovaniensis]KAG2393160.1 hypothetical protein C9374_009737 [Naegleria lovaniensis]